MEVTYTAFCSLSGNNLLVKLCIQLILYYLIKYLYRSKSDLGVL